MERSAIDTVIWDVDNTLWDWIAYASQTYPAMSELIAQESGIARERVEACMQTYYSEAETMESSWLVQGLDDLGLFEGIKLDRNALIKKLQQAFHRAKNRTLKPYGGIERALDHSKNRGIKNVILTDAPAFHAASRLRSLNMPQKAFEAMYAMEDSMIHRIPEGHYPRFNEGRYNLDIPVTRVSQEKPHSDLEFILSMTRQEIEQRVVIVGDNYNKDMALAQRYGCLGLHALWGQPTPEQLKVLERFAPRRVLGRNASLSQVDHASRNIVGLNDPREIPNALGW